VGALSDLSGRISPKRDWPQKATKAAARQATLRGLTGERLVCSMWSMLSVTGGCGGRFEEGGEWISEPHKTSERWLPLLYGTLWNRCQV
jgi:hypothetical protein